MGDFSCQRILSIFFCGHQFVCEIAHFRARASWFEVAGLFIQTRPVDCCCYWVECFFEFVSEATDVLPGFDTSVTRSHERATVGVAKGTQSASGVFAGRLGLVGAGHRISFHFRRLVFDVQVVAHSVDRYWVF